MVSSRCALGQLELGQMNFVEFQLEVTATGELDCVLERLGKIVEQLGHLCSRLQILVLGVFSRATWIGERAPMLNTDPRLVRFEVLTAKKADLIRRNNRQASVGREFNGPG